MRRKMALICVAVLLALPVILAYLPASDGGSPGELVAETGLDNCHWLVNSDSLVVTLDWFHREGRPRHGRVQGKYEYSWCTLDSNATGYITVNQYFRGVEIRRLYLTAGGGFSDNVFCDQVVITKSEATDIVNAGGCWE